MLHINLDQWITQMVAAWQAMAAVGPWQQDGFLLLICLLICGMLFLTGTVIGLFVQSLWTIFMECRQLAEEDARSG